MRYSLQVTLNKGRTVRTGKLIQIIQIDH